MRRRLQHQSSRPAGAEAPAHQGPREEGTPDLEPASAAAEPGTEWARWAGGGARG